MRESWQTQIGLIFSAAGNAIGLGNLLRFPSKVALYGGGAFMIPYFIALLLVGIPLMILEWVVGRFAGARGKGSMVGICGELFNHNLLARVVGSLGVIIPLLIVCYYIYIESWTLAYGVLSLFGHLPEGGAQMGPFLEFFKSFIAPSKTAVLFLIITLLINWVILQRGVVKGIEFTAKVGIPALLIMGIFLSILTLSLGGGKGFEGLLFVFSPDISALKNPQVWLEASGQVFFTLSLGMGAIATYASYVKSNQDVLKAGFVTAGLNEFVEIVIGASIALPAAFALFGAASIPELAKEGTFRIGFVSMPAVLMSLPFGELLSAVWFLLLFLAALTSSLALAQPVIALLEEELKLSHSLSVNITMILISFGAFLSAYVPNFIDELDFWAGTFMLVFFALLEVILFVWIFGLTKFHSELTRDAFIRIPKPVLYFFGVVSPLFLIALLYQWGISKAPQVLLNLNTDIIIARVFIVLIVFSVIAIAIFKKGEPKYS
ncbi:MAG: sodium:calcium symporter [Aquificaceae bacterium]|nr:sodium:calcium symporter [Aquificaceae bacterium]MDW8236780.1 sodium:calcium symporter [Aquificaceae bacterium]